MRRSHFLVAFGLSMMAAVPSVAFTAEDCAESYIAEGLPDDARATALPELFVQPGQIGTDLICTLVPSETYGAIIQVSESIPGNPNAGFVQYFPDHVQILRTEGVGAGLALSACGPIPDGAPPEQNPGGVWCQIDLALGRGVRFDLEYDTEGVLAWLNFEVSAREDGILEGSSLAPVLPHIAPENLRAGIFLAAQDRTLLMRYIPPAGVFRMFERQEIIDLFYAIEEMPQALTIVIETGDVETGPFAQVDLPQDVVAQVLEELALLERLFRTDRGL